jgi:hypothetical protein
VETEKGRLALPEVESAFTLRAKELGIDPLLILCYGNPHYDNDGFPNSDEAIAAYANYCTTLAEKMRGRVGTFEIWNEWSVACGMKGKPGENTPEPYVRMLRAAHKAVKNVNEDITVIGIGGEHSERHFDSIEAMMRAGAGEAMDAFSVHCYRYPSGPEETDLAGEILKVAELARQQGAPPRVWVTEIGWPTHTGANGVDEKTQARHIVRTMALLQSTRVVEKVYWYDFKDDALKRDYNESNFGIVRHQEFNCAPKPAVVALSVFARATAKATPIRLWREGDCYAAIYRLANGAQMAIAWTTEATRTVGITGTGLKATDIMGNPIANLAGLALTPDAIYLTGADIQIEPDSRKAIDRQ